MERPYRTETTRCLPVSLPLSTNGIFRFVRILSKCLLMTSSGNSLARSIAFLPEWSLILGSAPLLYSRWMVMNDFR